MLVPTAVNLWVSTNTKLFSKKKKPNTYSVFNFFSAHKGFLKFGWENEWQGFIDQGDVREKCSLFSKAYLRKHFFFFPSEKAVNNHFCIRYSSYMLLSSQLYLKRWGNFFFKFGIKIVGCGIWRPLNSADNISLPYYWGQNFESSYIYVGACFFSSSRVDFFDWISTLRDQINLQRYWIKF